MEPLIIFGKSSILGIRLSSEYTFRYYHVEGKNILNIKVLYVDIFRGLPECKNLRDSENMRTKNLQKKCLQFWKKYCRIFSFVKHFNTGRKKSKFESNVPNGDPRIDVFQLTYIVQNRKCHLSRCSYALNLYQFISMTR